MAIVSADQSYTSSGIAVLSDDGQLLSCHTYKTDDQNDMYSRAWEFAQHVSGIAEEYDARFIAVEGLAYAKSGDSTRDLAGLQYVVICVLRFIHGYYVEVVYPTTVKKFATGKGNSNKDALVEHLPDQVRTHFDQQNAKKSTGLYDLTDAYWIGRVALDNVPQDYVSRQAHPDYDEQTLDELSEQMICEKIRRDTGFEHVRVNQQTMTPEVYANDRWVEIELIE